MIKFDARSCHIDNNTKMLIVTYPGDSHSHTNPSIIFNELLYMSLHNCDLSIPGFFHAFSMQIDHNNSWIKLSVLTSSTHTKMDAHHSQDALRVPPATFAVNLKEKTKQRPCLHHGKLDPLKHL